MTETITRDYTGVTTADIVKEMLTENTGRSLCDSGGVYGYNYSRNQGRDFASEPAVTCSWSAWRKEGETGPGHPDPDATISLYHWMVGCLDFDPEMQARLDAFVEGNEDLEDESWLGIAEAFGSYEWELNDHERKPNTVNTYNDPDNWHCSQVLQYIELYTEDSYEPSHLIVCVHGGCDVRGGYSAPKCFSLRKDYYEALDCARVDYLAAEDGCWRLCSASDNAPCDDICALPCYDIDWLDEDPAFVEHDDFVARIAREKAALPGTTLTSEQQWAANQQLDNAMKNVEETRLELAAGLLEDLHDKCTLVADGRLYLCAFGTYEEVTAGSNL